jgi:SAM-dependent methyltransferase/GT2 family glycosyltransferase
VPGAADYAEAATYFDAFAAEEERWYARNRSYHRLIEGITRFHVPAGERVLEIGCGTGRLLAALQPRDGVGVDISSGLIAEAERRHPDLRFVQAAGEDLDLDEQFDVIVLSDLVPYVHDLVGLFEAVRRHSHPGTRVVVNSYSRLWRPIIRFAELLHLKPRKPMRNWVSPGDVVNLLELNGFERVSLTRRILMPKRIPLLSWLVNGIVANIWPLNYLCLTYWIVARPQPVAVDELSVSVIVPCRNEEGHIAEIVERLPELGTATEVVWVEGNSTDGTRAEIERQIAAHPEREMRLVLQPGRGKGDAVRAGFAAATNDLFVILDGDVSVLPEALTAFYRAAAERRGELVNGTRLIYDVEPGAMRRLNLIANRVFSYLLTAITGQRLTDTLCGTKVLRREDYEKIAANRAYFGPFDPFGDFDLLLGAARLGYKIVDVPVRYHPRTYGTTNISRWRHGWLLARMAALAFWKFRVVPVVSVRTDEHA